LDYGKIAQSVSVSKWEAVSDRLVDFILTSKNDEKMPKHLADSILQQWKNGTLTNEQGLAMLLEAAVLLEPEKTLEALTVLGLATLSDQIREAVAKT